MLVRTYNGLCRAQRTFKLRRLLHTSVLCCATKSSTVDQTASATNSNNTQIQEKFGTKLEDFIVERRFQRNIIGYTREELERIFTDELGLPAFRAHQVWSWIYTKGVTDFSQMISISKPIREQLAEEFDISYGKIVSEDLAEDGTRKFLMKYALSHVESVFIPESLRNTVCVSSQVGCTYSCTFCYTGTQRIERNLSAGEIVGQVMTVKKSLFDFHNSQQKLVSNVVFMGQGEPFFNYRNIRSALNIIMDNNGLNYSKRKITISTSGVVPVLQKLGTDFPGIGLAISLHATDDKLRSQLVPANRQWQIAELISACRNFPGIGPFNRVTFEYVMLKDVNDSDEMAKKLADLVGNFPSLVNLIPFNPWPGTTYECSSNNRIRKFASILEENDVGVTIRWPRGRDILAACGQLHSASGSKKNAETKRTRNSKEKNN